MGATSRGDGASVRVHLLYTWRVTTAIRVFGLALATGIVLSDDQAGVSWPLLAALVVIASAGAALDSTPELSRTSWTAAAEILLAALMLSSAEASPGLYAYLAAPPVLTGVRHGIVATVNVTVIGALGVLAAVAAASTDPRPELIAAAPWLLSGLGAGMLSSWQSRSLRDLDARRAPYEAAHQLMEQLHQLATTGDLGLDSASLATDLDNAMRRETGCARSTVFVVAPDETVRPLNGGEDVERMALEMEIPSSERTPGAAVVPLRGARQTLGYCVLVGVPRWTQELEQRASEVADEFAVRLDTAVLFDAVRTLATSEERNRIAREMHDGVAQEIVGLGYIVDEIESISAHEQTRELLSALRTEITRLVSEIRFSIFDLRHEVTDGRLAASLADYAREISHAVGLRVHLSLNESGPPLAPGRATEVLRVAQEAIGNVRKHARADTLWVELDSDGTTLRLKIADDGVGNAEPRGHHWGLQGMRERAERIGADLTVSARPGGGTVVTLRSATTASHEGGTAHEHHRAVG